MLSGSESDRNAIVGPTASVAIDAEPASGALTLRLFATKAGEAPAARGRGRVTHLGPR